MNEKEIKVLILDDILVFAQEVAAFVQSSAKEFKITTFVETNGSHFRERLEIGDGDLKNVDIVFLASAFQDSYERGNRNELIRRLRKIVPNSIIVLCSGRGIPEVAHGYDLFISRADIRNRASDKWLEILNSYVTNQRKADNHIDPKLVIPVRQSISAVNERLAQKFRESPELLRDIHPRKFEELIAELFEDEGYTILLTPQSNDGGKDIYVFKRDNMIDTCYLVECKRYRPPNKVGVPTVRQLYGLIQKERVSGGVIVTTSYFTQSAKDFAVDLPHQLFLRNFNDLARWLSAGMK
jgi:DNA-binding NarL/FixJ family response regulator